MADLYDDEGNLIDPDDNGAKGDDPNSPAGLRAAKKATERENRELREKLARAQVAERTLAVQELKLDTTNKTVQKFLEHYQGEATPDALKAAAVEWGIVPDTTEVADQSIQGQATMAQTMGGGGTGQIPTTTTSTGLQVPGEQAAMWEEYERAVKSGDAQAGAAVLEKFGHGRDGLMRDHTMVPPGR